MAQLSSEKLHQVDAGLSADVRLPPPKELAEVPEHFLDDGPLKRVSEDNAALLKKIAALEEEQLSLNRKLDASRKENKSRGQKLTAARKEKSSLVQKLDASERANEAPRQKPSASQGESCQECGQKLCAAQQANKSLGQELSAFQRGLKFRQLLKEFRQKGMAKEFDIALLKKTRETFPSVFQDELFDRFGNPAYTFSRMVICLETERKNLQKEKKDDNPSSERLAKIVKKLDCLKAVSISFKKPEMSWDGNRLGEGYYSWCLYVADVDKACHPDMTKVLLDDMGKCAARGEYAHGEVKLGPVLQVAIKQMSIRRMVSTSVPRTGTGRPR